MDILILGGTRFLGRYLVEAALTRDHTVSLFNRGRQSPALFPDVEQLRGNRDGDLTALRGRRWDAVVDTCGYLPRVVGDSGRMLAESVGHYTFISSISVYAQVAAPGVDEKAPVGILADPTTEEIDGVTYGPLKALCEQAVEQAIPGRVLSIRPGLIVGPHDYTDRFTYWCVRMAQGGTVLAPGRPDAHVQLIDVRDLADWTMQMAEAQQTGIYNAVGPASPLEMGHMLETCRTVSGSDAQVEWVDELFLLDAGVQPWAELPFWVAAQRNPNVAYIHDIDMRRATGAGLTFRPLAETVRATLDWHAAQPADYHWRTGIDRAREAALLSAWQNHRQQVD